MSALPVFVRAPASRPCGRRLPRERNIQSQTNSAFDYLEYYSGGRWKDLNTPRHWIESTGQVCYCIEHTSGNPHGASYTATPPSSVFGANTLAGLQTILMFGYPCNTPDGFTEDDLKQCGENMNIKAKTCGEIIAVVRAAVIKWPEFAEDAGLSEDECESIRKVLLV